MAHLRRLAAGLVLAAALALPGCVPAPDPAAAPPGVPTPGYVQPVRASEVDLWRGVNDRGLTLDVRNPEEWNDALGHRDGPRQIPFAGVAARTMATLANARLLGPSGYGVFAGISGVGTAIGGLTGLGTGWLMLQSVSRQPATFASQWKKAWVTSIASGAAFALPAKVVTLREKMSAAAAIPCAMRPPFDVRNMCTSLCTSR